MTKRKIIPYNPRLKAYAQQLRNNSTRSEIKLWSYLKNNQMCGYDFHRQKPLLEYIVDFYCPELLLAIELDGLTHNWEEVHVNDERKEQSLKAQGITILRFNDGEVMNDIDNVLRSIEQWIIDSTHE